MRRTISPAERAAISRQLGRGPDAARIGEVSNAFNVPVQYVQAIADGKPTR